ncbi:unnamed protein product, partial [Urochloa humidicola]
LPRDPHPPSHLASTSTFGPSPRRLPSPLLDGSNVLAPFQDQLGRPPHLPPQICSSRRRRGGGLQGARPWLDSPPEQRDASRLHLQIRQRPPPRPHPPSPTLLEEEEIRLVLLPLGPLLSTRARLVPASPLVEEQKRRYRAVRYLAASS